MAPFRYSSIARIATDMENPTIVLASASPRRVDLLQQLGLPFVQILSPVEEPPPHGTDAETWAILSARAKAQDVTEFIHSGRSALDKSAPRIVVGADTVVCCDGELLGKPIDDEDAARMLRLLSGRDHTVCTGVALLTADGELSACESTRVLMAPLSSTAIDAYVDSGEPAGKAGAYAIQGRGGRFVERVEGCYYNVVGLPLARLCSLLESAGYDLDQPQDME